MAPSAPSAPRTRRRRSNMDSLFEIWSSLSNGSIDGDSTHSAYPIPKPEAMLERWKSEDSSHERMSLGLPRHNDTVPEIINHVSAAFGESAQALRTSILAEDAEKKARTASVQEHHESDHENVPSKPKSSQLSEFLPREGQEALEVFPARNPVPGENRPYELATGRQTTAPRRTRRPQRTQTDWRLVTGAQLSSSRASVVIASSSDENPQDETHSLATGPRQTTSPQGRRSHPGQQSRSRGIASQKLHRSSRHDMSNPSMSSEQSDVSQQPQQLAFRSFNQQTLASPSTFSISTSAPTLSNRQNHQFPRFQQTFSSPSDHQSYLQSPENFWQPNYEQPINSLNIPEQTSPNFLQEDQFAPNDHLLSSDYEALTAFNISRATTSEDLNISPPSLSTSSMSPPSNQSLSDSNPSGWAPTPNLSKPSGRGDQVEWQDCFEEFVNFGSMG